MNLALNPFDKGKKPEAVEAVSLEPCIERAVNIFFKNLNWTSSNHPIITCSHIFQHKKLVLEPFEINAVFGIIHDRLLDDRMALYVTFLGDYTSKLIQMSHNSGISEFSIVTEGKHYFRNLANNISADGGLLLKVQGNCGDAFGGGCKNCRFEVTGDAHDMLGAYSHDCEFKVGGDAGHYCGQSSTRSKFTIEGKVDSFCGGGSTDSEFYAKKGYGDHPGSFRFGRDYLGEEVNNARRCTFKTNDPEESKKLEDKLHPSNKVVLE